MSSTPERTKQTKEKKRSLLEDARALSHRFEHADQFIRQNPRPFLWVGGVVAVLLLAFFGYRYYQDTRNEEAEKELFNAVYYLESDSLKLAMEGDGINYGFLQIIEKYGGTQVENLSHLYAGVCYLKMEKYTEAIQELESFSSSDWLLSARAYSLIGDAYMEQDQYKEAAEYYEKAAYHFPNSGFSPEYLKKLAIAYEKLDQPQNAIEAYLSIREDHYESALRNEVEKHIWRLKGLDTANRQSSRSFFSF